MRYYDLYTEKICISRFHRWQVGEDMADFELLSCPSCLGSGKIIIQRIGNQPILRDCIFCLSTGEIYWSIDQYELTAELLDPNNSLRVQVLDTGIYFLIDPMDP